MSLEPANTKPAGGGPLSNNENQDADPAGAADPTKIEHPGEKPPRDKEIGGPNGPEPTRYGDWEKNGRCIDF
jgi:hypothetical protein